MLTPMFPEAFSCWCLMKNPDRFSCLGYPNTPAINHVKCHGRFLVLFFLPIHGYFTREIFLGKVRSHIPTKFPAVKVSRVTAPNNYLFFSLGIPKPRKLKEFSIPFHVSGKVNTAFILIYRKYPRKFCFLFYFIFPPFESKQDGGNGRSGTKVSQLCSNIKVKNF